MDDQAPLAPTFLVELEREAHVEVKQDEQRHEVRAVVHRGEQGYRVHIRHVTNDVVMVDGEIGVEPGIAARVDASGVVVQLDLQTEEELRAAGRAGAGLQTETGCRSI